MKLHELSADAYGRAKNLFGPIPGAAFLLEAGLGKIFVDDSAEPQCAYLETPWGMHYFAGAYDRTFLKEALSHIFNDILPAQTLHPYVFAFGSRPVWLREIRRRTWRYKGRKAMRRLYHLNPAEYRPPERRPDGFRYALEERDGETRAVAYDGNLEAAHCGGSQGAGMMDLDVFVTEAYRRRGLGSTVTAMMIDHCLARGVQPQAGIWALNEPSWRTAEKLGFTLTAEFEGYIIEARKL